jgi:hypothetical protein
MRRIVIGLLLAASASARCSGRRRSSLLVLAIATGCLYEFAGLSARKGPQLEVPVAMAAVWVYIILTYFGMIHRYEGICWRRPSSSRSARRLHRRRRLLRAQRLHAARRALHRQADDVFHRDPRAARRRRLDRVAHLPDRVHRHLRDADRHRVRAPSAHPPLAAQRPSKARSAVSPRRCSPVRRDRARAVGARHVVARG